MTQAMIWTQAAQFVTPKNQEALRSLYSGRIDIVKPNYLQIQAEKNLIEILISYE